MFIITISRQTASLGNEIAENLADTLGVKLINRDYVINNWLSEIASDHELHMLQESSKFYSKKPDYMDITFAQYVENRLKEEADKESLVILGLGSQMIFRENPVALHIKVLASENRRIERIAGEYGMSIKQAERTVELSDRKHRRYVWRIYDEDWADPTLYHMSFNSDGLTAAEAVTLVMQLLDFKKETKSPLGEEAGGTEEEAVKEVSPDFAHPSEKEFAGILDMHKIKWEYEPTEFPLEWDAEGNITRGFRPDFYLSEYDTYIELTTMAQKYVTEKNKKVRLLQKTYPEVNINIVYKKDFKTLLERFGFENEGDED